MRSTYLYAFAVLSSLALLGCSSEKKGPGLENPYSTREKFCDKWANAACNDKVVGACQGSSTEACVVAQTGYCLSTLPNTYGGNKDAGETCVKAVEKAYADAVLTVDEYRQVREFAAPCDKLYEGPGEAGATCQQDSDCNTLDDLECVKKSEEESDGTCQIPVTVAGGAPCTAPDTICDENNYCDANADACLQRKTQGAICGPGVLCAQELQCIVGAGTSSCQSKVAQGADCNNNAECVTGVCAYGSGASTGKCVAEIQLTTFVAVCDDLN